MPGGALPPPSAGQLNSDFGSSVVLGLQETQSATALPSNPTPGAVVDQALDRRAATLLGKVLRPGLVAMAGSTEHLTLRQLGVATGLRPRPNLVVNLCAPVDVVEHQVFNSSALDAGLVREVVGSACGFPLALVLTADSRVGVRHGTKYMRDARQAPVAQLVEAPDLGSGQCGFESYQEYKVLS